MRLLLPRSNSASHRDRWGGIACATPAYHAVRSVNVARGTRDPAKTPGKLMTARLAAWRLRGAGKPPVMIQDAVMTAQHKRGRKRIRPPRVRLPRFSTPFDCDVVIWRETSRENPAPAIRVNFARTCMPRRHTAYECGTRNLGAG